MKSNHYVTLGMCLGALALMVAGLENWGDALKPQFIGGAMLAVSSVLKGMYQGSPNDTSTADIVKLSRGEK